MASIKVLERTIERNTATIAKLQEKKNRMANRGRGAATTETTPKAA